MFIKKVISTFAVVSTLSLANQAAYAEDIALVVGNKTYANASRVEDAEKALNAGRALRNRGYFVVSGRNMSADENKIALRELAKKLDEADRVSILLSGHFVHSGGQTWLVSVDADDVSIGTIGETGMSVNTLLQIAGEKPGGAIVFLGQQRRAFPAGIGLEAGIGELDIPQGVMLVMGTPGDVANALRREFLRPGQGFATSLENASPSLEASGFISDVSTLIALDPDTQQDDFGGFEGAYWQFAKDLGTDEGFENYLDRFPFGEFADQARDRLTEIDQAPLRNAKANESALKLSRSKRRAIQEDLSLMGFDPRGIDGVFGGGSRRAIGDWQRENGYPSTGYIQRDEIPILARQAGAEGDRLAEEARRTQREQERRDTAFWRASGRDGTEEGLRLYLSRYPDGLYADIAGERLAAVEEAKRGQAGQRDRVDWDEASDLNSAQSYRRYLSEHPDGAFTEEAQVRLTAFEDEAANSAQVAAAKAEEESLRMNILARVLVEKKLNALGLKAGVEDGNFDKKTRRAIRRYQKSRGITVTGYVTRQTAVRMLAEG
jgi:peptidoglycan hydrolase-like protein with peptidoglycan-binding domain